MAKTDLTSVNTKYCILLFIWWFCTNYLYSKHANSNLWNLTNNSGVNFQYAKLQLAFPAQQWVRNGDRLCQNFLHDVICKTFVIVTASSRQIGYLPQQQEQQPFYGLCPGLPGWASTRRNTHPPTILIIIQSLSIDQRQYCYWQHWAKRKVPVFK